jgi:phage shock protein A
MVQILRQWRDFVGRRRQRRGGLCFPAAEACDAAAEACKSSWTSLVRCVYAVANLMDFLWQAATFADHVASGALTSEFAAERQQLEGRIERLRAQHMEVVRDKSAVENKHRRLTEKLAAVEAEKEDLRR